MGNILNNIINIFLQSLGLTNKESTIVFLGIFPHIFQGLDNAGKTTLLHAISNKTITSFAPTEVF